MRKTFLQNKLAKQKIKSIQLARSVRISLKDKKKLVHPLRLGINNIQVDMHLFDIKQGCAVFPQYSLPEQPWAMIVLCMVR